MSDYPSMSHVQHITFEGNDCVVMSPEEYGAALADLEAKDYELSALRAELTEARRQLKEASEQGPAFDAAERPLRYGNGEGEPIKVRAYLHPTHDGLVTTDETAYTKPRELVLHDDVADRIDWLEKGIAEWRAVAMYAQEKLRSAKDAG